jgi:Tol biopolymer transport system component
VNNGSCARYLVATIVTLITVLGPTSTEARRNEMLTLESGPATRSIDSDESSAAVSDALNLNTGRLLFQNGNIGDPLTAFEIGTMNADGTNPRRVTCNNRFDQAGTWSPNGRTIIFHSQESINGLPTQNLYLIGADDPCGPGTFLAEGRFADWSPVQNRIVFDRGRLGVRDVWVRDMATGTEVIVTNDATMRSLRASWSPDGKTIAFARGPAGVAMEGTEDIYLIQPDGSGLTQLTFGAEGNNGPRFSPNGKKIVFASQRDGNTEIYVMNADGSEQTRLTDYAGADGFPNWSPNGQQIVFVRTTASDGNSHLFIMNADGSEETQITDGGAQAFPTWGVGHVSPPQPPATGE